MPTINYHLTADVQLTKDSLKQATSSLLAPDFYLGKDNRTWNRKQLDALKLLLCNVVEYGHKDKGIFLYSRSKTQIPTSFNPFDISYSSLIAVIDMLGDGKIIEHKKGKARESGDKLADSKTSEFTVTKRTYDLAEALGIKKNDSREEATYHVRLRDRQQPNLLLEFEPDTYTQHIDELMADYCAYLNKYSIMHGSGEWLEDEAKYEVIKHYGEKVGGEKIHLFRSYRNWDKPITNKNGTVIEDYSKEFEQLWIETKNPNMSLGGRSGSFWQGARKEHRPYLLINGSKTKIADFPACHLNLCYYNELGKWYQLENKDELAKAGRIEEDAYYLKGVHRDIVKQFIQIMFNVKGRPSVSRVFNKWLKDKCDPDLAEAHKKTGISNIEILNQLEAKHSIIKDYFYKGKIAGQIISWQEANMIHHLAWDFIQKYDVPVLCVYDELCCPEVHQQLLCDWLFYEPFNCEICNKYSLMSQIKNL